MESDGLRRRPYCRTSMSGRCALLMREQVTTRLSSMRTSRQMFQSSHREVNGLNHSSEALTAGVGQHGGIKSSRHALRSISRPALFTKTASESNYRMIATGMACESIQACTANTIYYCFELNTTVQLCCRPSVAKRTAAELSGGKARASNWKWILQSEPTCCRGKIRY